MDIATPTEQGVDPLGIAVFLDAVQQDPRIEPHGLISSATGTASPGATRPRTLPISGGWCMARGSFLDVVELGGIELPRGFISSDLLGAHSDLLGEGFRVTGVAASVP